MLTSQGGVNMTTQNLKVFFHVLAQRYHFIHIYIPFILSLFNDILNNGELRCFELI